MAKEITNAENCKKLICERKMKKMIPFWKKYLRRTEEQIHGCNLSHEQMCELIKYLEGKIKFEPNITIVGCDGTLKLTEEWLKNTAKMNVRKREKMLAWLQQNQGYCDCEVIRNVDPERLFNNVAKSQ